MTFSSFEDIITLLCAVAGLLACVFRYVETPRRGYRILVACFLAFFLSEYYWTIYELVMHDYPDVSGFVAYMGWNVGYFFLLLAVFFMRRKEARRYFHPLILLPVLFSVPQFLLYISFGGILNNVYEVGITTLTMVFCLQDLVYYAKHKEDRRGFPWLSTLVLAFIVLSYGMWTASCFDWRSELLSPYLYLSVIVALLRISFAFGAKRFYDSEEPAGSEISAGELRLAVLIQSLVSIVIIAVCASGFFAAFAIRRSLENGGGFFRSETQLIIVLFAISAVLILLILGLLYAMTSRYRKTLSLLEKMGDGKRNRINLIVTLVITLALMSFAVIYNNVLLYRASVLSVYDAGDEAVSTTATKLENYLTEAVTTLRVAADSVGLMEKNGSSEEEIERYIVDQTAITATQFDENFTGIYAYMNGSYLDGLGWVPPEGYDPVERDWYKVAAEAGGRIVIVSPYVDAQTGSVVVTIAKSITTPEGNELPNVVCLDVIVNYITEVTKAVEIAGKGYGLVVNDDGFIIAHREDEYTGGNMDEIYGPGLLDSILGAGSGRITANIDGEACTLFIAPVMDQWHAVIVVDNTELFEDAYSQLAISVMVSLITFCLISFFYYIGYKNEQLYGRKVRDLNIQVVTALATAIDAKDAYTNGHSSRVAEYARMIASRAGCSKEEQDEIYMIGLLHDVGKIGVPDSVVNKPATLTEGEFDIVKKHPVIGDSILGSIKDWPKLATGARWHHERYDGKGYPDGISGEDIPEEARIIAVADAYDAMTSRRSYRDIMTQEQVRSEIEEGAGTQFDPRFSRIMLQMIDEDRDYTMREKI